MQCAPTAENGSGYACRGGLYIRPERAPIPAAVRRRRPPVGAEPLIPGANLNPGRAHMQCAPTAENGSGYACRGGLYIRPERPPIPAAVRRRRPPVGAEPLTPGANLNLVRAHMQCAPTAENGSGYACRGGLYIRPERPPFPAAVRRRRPPVGAEPLTPGANLNPIRAHIQCAPTAENGSGYACRADYISARKDPRFPPLFDGAAHP